MEELRGNLPIHIEMMSLFISPSIIHRLQADGWAEELKDYRVMDTIRKHKLARQSKALTDRSMSLDIARSLFFLLTEYESLD